MSAGNFSFEIVQLVSEGINFCFVREFTYFRQEDIHQNTEVSGILATILFHKPVVICICMLNVIDGLIK